jgi:hypothetical protein
MLYPNIGSEPSIVLGGMLVGTEIGRVYLFVSHPNSDSRQKYKNKTDEIKYIK